MPTSSGSLYFAKLFQNTRQAVTRRSRRSAEPTTTIIPIPTEPYPGPDHFPADDFTPTNVFEMFNNNDIPITSTYRPPYPAQSSHATTTNNPAPIPDDPVEVNLVTRNLAKVESSLEDVQFMNTVFLAKSAEHDLSEHIDLCTHIEESLESLRATLTHRTQIGAEEWGVRSLTWHQKHRNRLLSLRRTLQRLGRLRQLVEIHSHRSRQRTTIRTKLEQHEAKLADLASKYSAAFDRLKLRHLHFLLKHSHDEARNLRQSRRASRESLSFERRWAEGKKLRAGLRRNFNDQRDYLYNKSQLRSGRQSTAQ